MYVKEDLNVANFCNFNFRSEGGICSIADEKARIGKNVKCFYGRLDARGDRFAINTDKQMEIEMPTIRAGVDRLQGIKVISFVLIFAKNRGYYLC